MKKDPKNTPKKHEKRVTFEKGKKSEPKKLEKVPETLKSSNVNEEEKSLDERRTEIQEKVDSVKTAETVTQRSLLFATYVIQFMSYLETSLPNAGAYYSNLVGFFKKTNNNVYVKYAEHLNNIHKKSSLHTKGGQPFLRDSHIQSLYKELPEVLHTIIQGKSMYWFLTEKEKDELRSKMFEILRDRLHQNFLDEEIQKIVKMLLSPEYYISAADAYSASKQFEQQIMS